MIDADEMVRQAFRVLLVTLALLAIYALGQGYYRWRLRAWAGRNGLRLIDFRDARRSEIQDTPRRSAFYVEVEDRFSRRRRASVVFGRWLGLDFWGTTSVEWDD